MSLHPPSQAGPSSSQAVPKPLLIPSRRAAKIPNLLSPAHPSPLQIHPALFDYFKVSPRRKLAQLGIPLGSSEEYSLGAPLDILEGIPFVVAYFSLPPAFENLQKVVAAVDEEEEDAAPEEETGAYDGPATEEGIFGGGSVGCC